MAFSYRPNILPVRRRNTLFLRPPNRREIGVQFGPEIGFQLGVDRRKIYPRLCPELGVRFSPGEGFHFGPARYYIILNNVLFKFNNYKLKYANYYKYNIVKLGNRNILNRKYV